MVVDLLESQQRFKIIGLTIVGCQADTNVLWLDRIGEFHRLVHLSLHLQMFQD